MTDITGSRICALLILVCLSARTLAEPVSFDWFEYTGRDAVFEQPLPAGSYRNPILGGFYPDPSIARAGDKFYLVNSTFAYFPGVPVFESTDLVHWNHIGNVIDRPSQLNFDGVGVSRGVFAPAIEFHAGTFYVLNTAVDSGGNFVSTAKNPAGPWSDPVWLPELAGGIDPSLFVDTDGKAYVINNGPPQGRPLYDGHRAIWIQDSPTLNASWLQVRVPKQPWADLRSKAGTLTIRPSTLPLDSLGNPSFLARRQQHLAFEASTAFQTPGSDAVAAGMAAFQSENYWYFLGARRVAKGMRLFLEKKSGKSVETIATATIEARQHLKLKISGDARAYSFFYDADGRGWKALRQNDDGSILSTDVAGGFVGAVIGPYARAD